MGRLVRWIVGVSLVQGALLALLAWLLDGFSVGGAWSVVLLAALVMIAQAVAWPFMYRLSAVLHPLLFPVASFALSGFLVVLIANTAADIGIDGLRVDTVQTGIIIACGLTFGSTLLGAFFSLNDEIAYDWFVTRPLKRRYAGTTPSSEPGLLFLEIDGLAEPVLRRAIAEGHMPTLPRWLERGSHRITPWEPDLSSQTSASQAGILLGDNTDIPAFRWYDKTNGSLMVSSKMATARELERRLASGEGLLKTGASRWNVFSGEAPDSLCTYSTFGVRGREATNSYLAYFANPYTLSRAIALYFGDVIRERWQAWRQLRRDDQPRIKRSWRYAFIRAATTTVMQEAGLFMLLADLYRGVPAVYCTFFAYDEVAHHSGIDRPDAFSVLEKLDRVIATLERAATTAPRPYHLVVLSDHGQSMGATFRQRTGQTLGELVTSLIDPNARVMIDEQLSEDQGHLRLAIEEVLQHRFAPKPGHRVHRKISGWVAEGDRSPGTENTHDVIVLASGNLGLVSFPAWSERMSFEAIVERFPALIPGLLAQKWVGFVMVRSERDGALVLGGAGITYLDHDEVEGVDPLAVYGANAAAHLRRTDRFANAPDLLVMSAYDPETGAVAAFEELVGSHGGLGGPQTRPFVLHPIALDHGAEPIVGAAALHRVLAGWRAALHVETES
jgi:uncharacterized membrane protein YvlD (DUF360 family)